MDRQDHQRAAAEMPIDKIDVSDPGLYQNDTWPPYFRRLRQECPVHYCADGPYGAFWSVASYDHILEVELNHQAFSNAAELGGIQLESQPTALARPSFILMDPPKHTAQRRVVAPMVGRASLADVEATMRRRTAAVLDALPRGQTFDWADLVSTELTSMMLATMFDYPQEDRRQLTHWSDVAMANVRADDAAVRSEEERFEVLAQMAAAFDPLWQARAGGEGIDLISMLANDASTKNMERMEFMGTLVLLIVGGNDTTRNSMTGGLLALHENPDQYAKLRCDPSLIASMVQEMIRYQTPVLHMRRTALEDVALNGQAIAKGDKVVMWYISGNRDDAAIENADAFIIDRKKPRRHLSFGAGIHRCIGDRLAELQLRVLWQEILAREIEIEVVGPPVRVFSNFIRGFKSLPARIAN